MNAHDPTFEPRASPVTLRQLKISQLSENGQFGHVTLRDEKNVPQWALFFYSVKTVQRGLAIALSSSASPYLQISQCAPHEDTHKDDTGPQHTPHCSGLNRCRTPNARLSLNQTWMGEVCTVCGLRVNPGHRPRSLDPTKIQLVPPAVWCHARITCQICLFGVRPQRGALSLHLDQILDQALPWDCTEDTVTDVPSAFRFGLQRLQA